MAIIALILAMFCVLPVVSGACCPSYWTAYNGKCYRLFEDKYEWGTAENVCVNQQGGHLVSVVDLAEHNFLKYLVFGHTDLIWLGGNDIAAEGQWQWTDGTEYKFSAWNSGEPDGGTKQDCILWFPHGNWVDDYCYEKRHFICERPSS